MTTEDQTFSESWYRIASKRIALRPDVRISRQRFRGELWYVIENPLTNQFYRIRPESYEMVSRLNGKRTVDEIWNSCLEHQPHSAPGQGAVIKILTQLYEANLISYTGAEDATALFERNRRRRKKELKGRFASFLFLRIPLLDPNGFLKCTSPLVAWLISPIGLALWICVLFLGVKTALSNWDSLTNGVDSVLAPSNLALLYVTLIALKLFHELGHGYFCRKFGGEVHTLGVMLLVFSPMPYVDATASWGFRNRWQRMLTAAAGMIVELFIAAIAIFVWANTSPGTVHSIAYNVIFIASVSTILFNINPLLRFDGYFILCDLIGAPNLYQRATQQLKHLSKRMIFGLKSSKSPSESTGDAALLITYGIASLVYRILLLSGIVYYVSTRFFEFGLILAAAAFFLWAVVPLCKFVAYIIVGPELAPKRNRAIVVVTAVLLLSLGGLGLIPFPAYFRADGVIDARSRSSVVTGVDGYITSFPKSSGSRVSAGEVIASLENPELKWQLKSVEAQITELESRMLAATDADGVDTESLKAVLKSIRDQQAKIKSDIDALETRSTIDGVWVASGVMQLEQSWTSRGTQLGMVVSLGQNEFAATVRQTEADRLFEPSVKLGDPQIRLMGQPEALIATGDLVVIPAEKKTLPSAALGWSQGGDLATIEGDETGRQTREPFFEIRTSLPEENSNAALLHGRSGVIRISIGHSPLLTQWMRKGRQLFQQRYGW